MSEEMKINVYPLIEVVDKNSNISVVSHDSLYGRGATVNFEYKEMRLSTYQEILALLKCLETYVQEYERLKPIYGTSSTEEI